MVYSCIAQKRRSHPQTCFRLAPFLYVLSFAYKPTTFVFRHQLCELDCINDHRMSINDSMARLRGIIIQQTREKEKRHLHAPIADRQDTAPAWTSSPYTLMQPSVLVPSRLASQVHSSTPSQLPDRFCTKQTWPWAAHAGTIASESTAAFTPTPPRANMLHRHAKPRLITS